MAITNATQTMAGRFVFVTGIGSGREVFFGKAIDEPFSEQVSIEGKPITWTPQGTLAVRPFATVVNFPIKDPNYQVQVVNDPNVVAELTDIHKVSLNQITRANFPLTYRWVESAVSTEIPLAAPWNANGAARTAAPGRVPALGNHNPFYSFFLGFTNSAEQFRRALFTSPQVTTTKEMDKITELEGDLTIEIGKITNDVAVKFNQLVARDTELVNYFDWVAGYNLPIPPTNQIGGWLYLIHRIQIAKSWGRRHGKTPLVRETNTLIKEGIHRLNETILDHCGSMDTLITETCAQYGIQVDTFGEMSPFSNYTTPFSGSFESEVSNAMAMPVGAAT